MTEMFDAEAFARRLRSVRDASAYDDKASAVRATGLDRARYAALEAGRATPNAGELSSIGHAFNISIDWLVNSQERETPSTEGAMMTCVDYGDGRPQIASLNTNPRSMTDLQDVLSYLGVLLGIAMRIGLPDNGFCKTPEQRRDMLYAVHLGCAEVVRTCGDFAGLYARAETVRREALARALNGTETRAPKVRPPRRRRPAAAASKRARKK